VPSTTATPAPPAAAPTPPQIAKPAPPVKPAPANAKADAAHKPVLKLFGLEPLQIATLGGGVLLLIVLVVMLMRRRRLPNDLDVTALADEDEPDSITEGLDFGAGERSATPTPVPPPRQMTPPPSKPAPKPPIAAPAGSFSDNDQELFDTSEKGESKMNQDTLDLPVSRSGRPAASQATTASAGDSDVGRLVRELERRVAQLETRLDEANDARERLERQVAAQSEELRVQRAAIARTQRALRGMNRGEEEQATEPALREPNRQGS